MWGTLTMHMYHSTYLITSLQERSWTCDGLHNCLEAPSLPLIVSLIPPVTLTLTPLTGNRDTTPVTMDEHDITPSSLNTHRDPPQTSDPVALTPLLTKPVHHIFLLALSIPSTFRASCLYPTH